MGPKAVVSSTCPPVVCTSDQKSFPASVSRCQYKYHIDLSLEHWEHLILRSDKIQKSDQQGETAVNGEAVIVKGELASVGPAMTSYATLHGV